MYTSTVELNDKIYFVNYEFIEGEQSDWEYPGCKPNGHNSQNYRR